MTQPSGFFVDANGQTLKSGILINPDGSILFITLNSSGQQVISAGAGGNVTNVGTFLNSTVLQAAFPAANNTGSLALVGATAPFTQYSSNGVAWVAAGSGGGAVSSVNTKTGIVVLSALDVNGAPMPGTYTWDATANIATDGTNTTALASGAVPMLGGKQVFAFTVSNPGTTSLDGNAIWNLGDIAQLQQNGAGQVWYRNASNPLSGIAKSDTAGGLISAIQNVDYGVAPSLQMSIPVIVPPSWVSAPVNGAITFGTAITANTSTGYYADGALIYFSANVLNGSNAAGYYYATFSSSTVAQVTTSIYTPGTPFTIPTSLVNIIGTGSAGSSPTATDTMSHAVIGTNLLGKQGNWRTDLYYRNPNNANAKNVKTKINNSSVGWNISGTTNTATGGYCTVSNKGKTNVQGAPYQDIVFGGNSGSSAAVDTTQSCTYGVYWNLAVATDWQVIESVSMIFKFLN